MAKINVLVSKIVGNGSVVSTTKDTVSDYTDYYKLIKCTTFDVVRVTWKGQRLSLFVDDEGLMKPFNYGRDVVYDDTTMETTELFGTIVVTGDVDEEGETLGVPDEITLIDLIDLISDVKYQVKGD